MELSYPPRLEAFRAEVRAFLEGAVTEGFRTLALETSTVFAEPPRALDWQRVLDDQGWLVPHWPEEAGGIGWTPLQRFIFDQELARAGAPVLPGMGLKLVGPVLYTFGTAAQKARYIPPLRRGSEFWAQGFSEPGSGSDLASLRTKAVRTESGDWRVTGSKLWTTMAQHATHLFCLVRTNPDVKPQQGISFLLIDMRQPGVTVRPILNASGDHEVNEVFLDNVHVPADDLIGAEGQGWSIAKFLLENERGGSCYGAGLRAEAARLQTRAEELGAGDPIMARIARVTLEARALEMTELRILSAMEAGSDPGPQSLTTKLIASEIHQSLDLIALDLEGEAGLLLPPPGDPRRVTAARYLNGRAWSIFGGTSEIQLTIIAKAALGL